MKAHPAVDTAEHPAEYRDALVAFIRRMVGEDHVAEDLAQETLLRADRTRASFHGRSSLRTWLFAIAVNMCRDFFRARARNAQRTVEVAEADRLPADVDIEYALAQEEMSACISGYVLQLPKRQREIVALHDIGELDHAEVSRLLGISEANARVLLHRGRAALRELLEQNCVLAFDDSVPCEPRERC